MIADDRGSFSIVCDQLRSCDHMETKVLRSAIETYPIIFGIPTHDSTQQSNCLFENVAGVEQGNFNNEELIEEVNKSAFSTVKISKTKTRRLTDGKKSWRNLNYRRPMRKSNSAT